MFIRRATFDDADVIIQNNITLALESEGISLDPLVVSEGVKNILRDRSKGFYIVIEEDGNVIGQTMITYEWSDWNNNLIWWIQSVYVSKNWRKKGIFSSLFKEIKKQAKQQKIHELRLYVHHHNTTANTVYGQLGFQRKPYYFYGYSI